jgi:chromosome segregation ATPase
MPTLKEQLEKSQQDVERLTSDAAAKDETISNLQTEIVNLKKTEDEAKSKKTARKASEKDDQEEDKKDGGKDEEEEGEGDEQDGKDGEKSKKMKAAADTAATTEAKISELQTQIAEAQRDLRSANARIKELEGEKKTIDETAEVKAREIAARNGGNLPAKEHRAGDPTTEKDPKAGSWRERLSSFWKIAA